jgi:hypothetical protein
MNYLLLQNEPCIHDLRVELARKYPESSIYRGSLERLPKTSPLLTSKWIVFVAINGQSIKRIRLAKQCEASAHIIFVTSQRSGTVQKLLVDQGIEFSTIDNLHASENAMVRYVMARLSVTEAMAGYIVKRSNRYEPALIKNVGMLSVLGASITRKAVDRYVPDSSFASLGRLYDWIVTGDGDYKHVIQIVYAFQERVPFLVRYICSRIRDDEALFEDILNGKLTSECALIYAQEAKVPHHIVERGIALFGKVSCETLRFLYLRFSAGCNLSCGEFIFVLKGLRHE